MEIGGIARYNQRGYRRLPLRRKSILSLRCEMRYVKIIVLICVAVATEMHEQSSYWVNRFILNVRLYGLATES